MNRFVRRTFVVLISAVALLAPPSAALAVDSKAAVLSRWTQTTASSTTAWNDARLHRDQWTAYSFNWTTDYCSSSPDNPLGFNFSLSCWHHDFGYRNYKEEGAFRANKDRLDHMLYADLKRKCATYSSLVRPACYSLAWTYFQAVSVFGSLEAVNPSDIDRARSLME